MKVRRREAWDRDGDGGSVFGDQEPFNFFERRRVWVQRVHDVGTCVVGEKNNLFLAEMLFKLRFFGSS
jgi:hypothetical protein